MVDTAEQTRTVDVDHHTGAADDVPLGLLFCSNEELRVVDLPEDSSLVVGRSSECDITIAAPSLSRNHARFVRSPSGLTVEDLDSHNGVRVAGEKVSLRGLRIGDTVQLGRVVAVVTDARESAVQRAVHPYEQMQQQIEQTLASASQERPCALLAVRCRGAQGALPIGTQSGRLHKRLRADAVMGVYDRDTLMVLLPSADTEDAKAVANGLCVDAAQVVIGVASYPAHATGARDLVAAAAAASKAESGVHLPVGGDAQSERGKPIVENASMRELYELISRVGRTDVPVLLLGETGSGKELVAEALHRSSSRSHGPYQVVNCAAMAETLLQSTLFGHERGAFTGAQKTSRGIFEVASGGTLFLDEIGELSSTAQAALLRALETKRITRVGSERDIAVDVRIVAATHRPLEEMVAEGSFREDLFHRLNTLIVTVPPLRDRRDEIAPLSSFFLDEAVRRWNLRPRAIDDAAAACLQRHHWPGNVRELRNCIERAAAICRGEQITVGDLPAAVRAARGVDTPPASVPSRASLKDQLQTLERTLIKQALEHTGGNQSKAAELLKMPRRTFIQRIRTFGLHAD